MHTYAIVDAMEYSRTWVCVCLLSTFPVPTQRAPLLQTTFSPAAARSMRHDGAGPSFTTRGAAADAVEAEVQRRVEAMRHAEHTRHTAEVDALRVTFAAQVAEYQTMLATVAGHGTPPHEPDHSSSAAHWDPNAEADGAPSRAEQAATIAAAVQLAASVNASAKHGALDGTLDAHLDDEGSEDFGFGSDDGTDTLSSPEKPVPRFSAKPVDATRAHTGDWGSRHGHGGDGSLRVGGGWGGYGGDGGFGALGRPAAQRDHRNGTGRGTGRVTAELDAGAPPNGGSHHSAIHPHVERRARDAVCSGGAAVRPPARHGGSRPSERGASAGAWQGASMAGATSFSAARRGYDAHAYASARVDRGWSDGACLDRTRALLQRADRVLLDTQPVSMATEPTVTTSTYGNTAAVNGPLGDRGRYRLETPPTAFPAPPMDVYVRVGWG